MNIAYTRSELFDLNAARFAMVHWWIALFTGVWMGTGQLCRLPRKRVRLNTCRQLVRK
jgi:hypothetical protein